MLQVFKSLIISWFAHACMINSYRPFISLHSWHPIKDCRQRQTPSQDSALLFRSRSWGTLFHLLRRRNPKSVSFFCLSRTSLLLRLVLIPFSTSLISFPSPSSPSESVATAGSPEVPVVKRKALDFVGSRSGFLSA